MLKQYLQSTHIPVVEFQGQGSTESEMLPDWHKAAYVDLHERTLDVSLYIVSDSDLGQPDRIAWRVYGDSNWWWLICSYNGIINPMTDMYLGQRLRIPALHQAQLSLQALTDVRREDRRGKTVTI